MSGKVVYRDFGLTSILKRVDESSITRVRVGLVGSKAGEPSSDGRLTHAEVGMINMYGSDDGVVPARDFLREPFNRKRAAVTRFMKDAAKRMLGESWNGRGESAAVAMDWLGGVLADIVRNAIISKKGVGERNAPSTIAKKGFDHPLFETAGLAEAISHQVVRGSGDVLDAGSAIGDYEGFSVTGSPEAESED